MYYYYHCSAQSSTGSTGVMRSQASRRFTRLHPESHSQFRAMMLSAKMSRDVLHEDEEDAQDDLNNKAHTPEISNMLKNKILTQFRAGDDDVTEIQRRSRKMISKKLSWSQNLIQVQILFDWH